MYIHVLCQIRLHYRSLHVTRFLLSCRRSLLLISVHFIYSSVHLLILNSSFTLPPKLALLRNFMTSKGPQQEGQLPALRGGRGQLLRASVVRNRPSWLGGLCRARIRKKDVVLHNPACLLQTIKQGRVVRRCRTGSVRKTPLD